MNRITAVTLVALVWFLSACAGSAGTTEETVLTGEDASSPAGKAALLWVDLDPTLVQRKITRQILGQGVWYSWQAYAWDFESRCTCPGAMEWFKTLGMGIVGHYPGVGVITHDFHWQNLIGPLNQRTDPTPRESSFDSPQYLEFGPDEYGQLIEEYRAVTGRPVEGSIQVNIVTGTAEEAADWVEYMNAPNDGTNPGGGIDWAAVRAANGHHEPYHIRYWELGNEPHFTASNIGQLTAREYVDRIREFVPRMKERDPTIEVMGYVNPFEIGEPSKVGTATADLLVEPGVTWSQAIIRDAGDYLDHVYFHWYGGWNDRRHGYEFVATSMYTGLIPLLDRLIQDINAFASTERVRDRLSRIFIPEWNVYGGWTRPLAKGTALQGAIAYSRTLHVFASREEVYSAQHLGLLAPYPDPPMELGLLMDIREGYFTIRAREDESDFMGTALAAVAELWSRAFAPEVVSVTVAEGPAFANGVPALDITALHSSDGGELNVIITHAGQSPQALHINLNNFTPQPEAVLLSVTGEGLPDNNSWEARDRVTLQEGGISLTDTNFAITVPAYSIQAVLMKRAP